MLRLLSLLLLLAAPLAQAQEFEVDELPDVITEFQLMQIHIRTGAELVFGKLPKHPKIVWLEQSNRRFGDKQNLNSLDFVVTAPGLLEFPPIPIILENKEFFVRLKDVRVARNTASKTDTQLSVFWNDLDAPPQQVHLGESVEVRFEQRVELKRAAYNRSYFRPPSSRISGGQWHQYVKVPGRRAYPEDFYFSYARGFWDGGNRNFKFGEREIEGKPYEVRTYKSRLYFTELGQATGYLSSTMGTSVTTQRTHLIPFNIEVLPLPPLPNSQAIDSGLVGQWQFRSSVVPGHPAPSEPLSIRMAVEGLGNPKLRNKLDFSGEGFPSVETNWNYSEDSNYDKWRAIFEQTLIPTGKVGTLPARSIAYFDTVEDKWQLHQITPALTLPGFTDVTTTLTPRETLGQSITRPVLLNLPIATFAAFALAPFLPFLFGYARKRLDARDPVREARQKKLQELIKSFQSGQGSSSDIDDDLLPLLREHLALPGGATAREVADALSDEELADLLRQHAESSFSTTAKPIDFRALATRLTRLALLFLLCLTSLRAATLEEANAAFSDSNFTTAATLYEELIKDHPGNPSLYFNLAQARLSTDETSRARAACHTAILLDPLDKQSHDLMSEIRKRQGDETVTGSRFLSLRPDQWLILSAFLWVISFLYFGYRKLRPLPMWPGAALLALALVLASTGIWKQFHDYSENQYMVLADELPREPEAGTPNWDYPPLRAGQLITISEVTATHALVTSSESPFWLPIHELQQVW
ncbi:tetratricopeptide repeat protein [Verrucomicrobiaceae bacterium 227]